MPFTRNCHGMTLFLEKVKCIEASTAPPVHSTLVQTGKVVDLGKLVHGITLILIPDLQLQHYVLFTLHRVGEFDFLRHLANRARWDHLESGTQNKISFMPKEV